MVCLPDVLWCSKVFVAVDLLLLVPLILVVVTCVRLRPLRRAYSKYGNSIDFRSCSAPYWRLRGFVLRQFWLVMIDICCIPLAVVLIATVVRSCPVLQLLKCRTEKNASVRADIGLLVGIYRVTGRDI